MVSSSSGGGEYGSSADGGKVYMLCRCHRGDHVVCGMIMDVCDVGEDKMERG